METYLAIKPALVTAGQDPTFVDPDAVDRLKQFADGLSGPVEG